MVNTVLVQKVAYMGCPGKEAIKYVSVSMALASHFFLPFVTVSNYINLNM